MPATQANTTNKLTQLLRRLVRLRMADWLLYALLLLGLVWFMAPQQLPVVVYKLTLLSLAAVGSYWIDRSMFPYARPDVLLLGHEPITIKPGQDTRFTDLSDAVSFTEATLETAAPLDAASSTELLALGAVSMFRRAVIVGGAMLAVSLGA